jgi:hypothetical protein
MFLWQYIHSPCKYFMDFTRITLFHHSVGHPLNHKNQAISIFRWWFSCINFYLSSTESKHMIHTTVNCLLYINMEILLFHKYWIPILDILFYDQERVTLQKTKVLNTQHLLCLVKLPKSYLMLNAVNPGKKIVSKKRRVMTLYQNLFFS